MQLEPIEPLLELFTALGRVADETRRILARGLSQSERRLPPQELERLQAALAHLAQVREGFIVTSRASDVHDPSELRALVRHILVGWSWLEELGLSWERGEQRLESPVAQVLAYAHASVALGYLPRLPRARVTYPYSRGDYADIPVPGTPGEWLARIEELEAVIAQMSERPPAALARDRLRRTYGYFDASAWLVADHVRRWRRAS